MLAIVGAFCPILAAIGGAIGVIVVIVQYRSAGPVTLHFSVADWKADGDDWVLRIPPERHGRRNPTALVGKQTEHGWTKVWANPYIEADGTITIRIPARESPDSRVACEVRIN